jgi:predicted MFS family arabinose efflux permease
VPSRQVPLPDDQASAGTGTLLLVTATIFGFVTSVTMIGPLLVDLAREFQIPVGRAGLLATAMAVPWALGSPFAGFVSDRLGRRPMIVLALGGVGSLYIVAATAGNFTTLVMIRILAGVVGSCGPSSVMATVGDLFPAARRARAMGWLNMGFSLAAVAGVPLVGVVGGLLGWRWAFAATGAAMVLLSVLIRLAFPAPPRTAAAASVLATYQAVFRVSRLFAVLSANLVERSMFAMMTLYLPAFLMLRYDLNAAAVAPALAVVAIGTIAGNILGGWLGDRFLRPAVFVASQVTAGALGLALLGLPVRIPTAMLLGALFGLANASSRPAFLALSSDLSPHHRGAVFGLVALTNQGGLVLGSLVGALVIELSGYRALAVVAVCLGCLAAALAAPLVMRGYERV